jgi:phosphoenolpyruvate carboxykinase (GTP)
VGDINTEGLEISHEDLSELLSVDREALREQLPQVEEHLARFGDRLPQEIRSQLEALKQRLG